MDARTIDQLSAFDPASRIPRITVAEAVAGRPGSPLHAQASVRFLSRYSRVAFGWYIASQFANARQMFPIPMTGRDHWVFQAYLMTLDPWLNYNKHVSDAYHMAHECLIMSGTIKALLLTCVDDDADNHIRAIAARTGVSYKTLEAFEALFYNVLDRREDALFIAREVYPNTRLVEFSEDYYRDTPMDDLLKRAGYNHKDLDLTSYLAGIGDRSYMSRLAAMEDREAELSRHIMGNGLLMTRTHLLNHRSAGMSRATNLLAASRQAGAGSSDPALASIAPAFHDELMAAVHVSQSTIARMIKEDAGIIIDA